VVNMAVERDKKIVIPKQFDTKNGTLPAFREDFDASRDQRMADHIRDHNHTIDQADDKGAALKNGRRRLSHRSPEQSFLAKKKKDKENSLLRRALKQLLDRINEEIAAIDQRLEEIESELHELEHLQDLAEKGTLDPKNPAHAKLLQKYGITQDDLDSGRLSIILSEKMGHRVEEQTELQKRKEYLQEQANEAISEAEAYEIISTEEAVQFRQHLDSIEAAISSQVRLTSHASQELKDVAIDRFARAIDDEMFMGGLDLDEGIGSSFSFASSLEGDGSYATGVQSEGKDLSIKAQFAASAHPVQHDPALQPVIDQTAKLTVT
jgi:hypothetical protein